jgi:peroxiredoxin
MNRVGTLCLRFAALAGFLSFVSCSQSATDKSPNSPRDQATSSSAERAWRKVLEASEPPDLPKEWEDTKLAPKQIVEFRHRNGQDATRAADQARDFYTRFPDHPKAVEARVKEYRQLAVAVHFGHTDRTKRLDEARADLEKRFKLGDEERYEMKAAGIHREVYLLQTKRSLVDLADFEAQVRELQKEFPKNPEPLDLLTEAAKSHLANNQIDKATALAKEVVASSKADNEPARGILKRADLIRKPLSLEYKAVDGREVDLEKMRGKVVLVDFWATWCTICMVELPKVKAAYQRFHPRGFEIVGITLDEEKAELDKLIKKEKIPWPQYFDGKGWENKFAQEFIVTSLPLMVLVDKKGIVRDLNAQEDLAEKVEKLLNEPL